MKFWTKAFTAEMILGIVAAIVDTFALVALALISIPMAILSIIMIGMNILALVLSGDYSDSPISDGEGNYGNLS